MSFQWCDLGMLVEGLGCWFSFQWCGGKVPRSGSGPCPTVVLQSLMFLNILSMSQSLEYKHHEDRDVLFICCYFLSIGHCLVHNRSSKQIINQLTNEFQGICTDCSLCLEHLYPRKSPRLNPHFIHGRLKSNLQRDTYPVISCNTSCPSSLLYLYPLLFISITFIFGSLSFSPLVPCVSICSSAVDYCFSSTQNRVWQSQYSISYMLNE